MIGQLNSEIPNTWTLRIPSHIGPRYLTHKQLLEKMFNKVLKKDEKVKESYLINNVEWSFNIELNCSDKIVDWKCSSHKLRQNKVNEKFFLLELDEDKIPEKDLEFTFERENPHEPLCTVAD